MIETDLAVKHPYSPDNLREALCAHLPLSDADCRSMVILHDEIVADGKEIFHRLRVGLSLSADREAGLLKMRKKVREHSDMKLEIPSAVISDRPIVIGFGPAGIFAALILAEAGAMPIVFERGADVDNRKKAVDAFSVSRCLSVESNIQFGEGGAGAFSDGKLKVGASDPVKQKVLESFAEAGAPASILVDGLPHIGTDRLPGVVKRLREKILSLGGEVHFCSRMTELLIRDGEVTGVHIKDAYGEHMYESRHIFLAIGHSARDSYRMLQEISIPMEARPFGIGMRIEHPRTYINDYIYGKGYPSDLPTASYRFVTHLPSGRNVYSFCMCPGGSVVAATSEEGKVVTNGMSTYARDGKNSNAALLVSVTPADFENNNPLAGVILQEKIESAAFLCGGGDYTAPALTLRSLLDGKPSLDSEICASYPLGVKAVHPREYMPDFIGESVARGIADFDAYRPGFLLPDAILTGAETRSTSPVRLLRDEKTYVSLGAKGLYPIGEGAGYAGGIVSSAADGIRAALAMLDQDL